MEWTGLNELREKFLSYFETKGHVRLPSYPLVPHDDDTLLLINAGMAPMKKFFLGQIKPPAKRVVTCQKCIRTLDIERVGKTARHGSFFEMLGNFSFGDYFKHEATAWGWEFVTKVLGMPEDRLWVTIYESDDEAFDIWTKEVGVDPPRVVRFGREDNFWEHGSLPCGPCSEIYYDRGEEYGCGKPTCSVGCDCDRYVEFWNIVFQQYDSDGKGHYTPLAKPNIDTGLGLERLACILQGVDNLFEVDTVRSIMKCVGVAAGVNYGEDAKKDVSLRVITDHIRSTVFMVGDGVLPSNEGRGYVLRRLLRRAARHGRLLGIEGGFLADLVDAVIKESGGQYPELIEKRDYIRRVIAMEEERFSATIDQGLSMLGDLTAKLAAAGEKTLSGDEAFRLYDTFGFPLDLTCDIVAEQGITVDEARFDERMKEQRERARAAHFAGGAAAVQDGGDEDTPETKFLGYQTMSCEAKIAAVICGGERAGFAEQGAKVAVILDQTAFYAESGGQVGDQGTLKTAGAVMRVDDCKKSASGRFLHIGEVLTGVLSEGDTVEAHVDEDRRRAIMRNHSAAHLLQGALRRVLGDHVHQAGQLVYDERVRFDFTHFAPLTQEEIDRVEADVNGAILAGADVVTEEMAIEEARKTGAMALFGEKYGSVVRVVKMGPYSVEFCGGTHVANTAKIGLFHIVSEASVAAGVRRIEGVTGLNVVALLKEREAAMHEAAASLKAGPAELVSRAAQVTAELHAKEKEIESLNGRIASLQLDQLRAGQKEIGAFHYIGACLKGAGTDALRLITDRVKESDPKAVVVLAGISGDKVCFAAACGGEAVKGGAHAGNLLKTAAKIAGGGGGGRPDSATAGGKDVSKTGAALEAAEQMLAALAK